MQGNPRALAAGRPSRGLRTSASLRRYAPFVLFQGIEPGGDAGGQTSWFHPDDRKVVAARRRCEAGEIRHPEEPRPRPTPAPQLLPGSGRKVRRGKKVGELADAAHRRQAHNRVPGLAADADQAGNSCGTRLVEKLGRIGWQAACFRLLINLLISL